MRTATKQVDPEFIIIPAICFLVALVLALLATSSGHGAEWSWTPNQPTPAAKPPELQVATENETRNEESILKKEEKRFRNRCIFISASWCGPCQPIKKMLPAMQAAGWTVSDKPDGHIWLMDADDLPTIESRKITAQIADKNGNWSIPRLLIVDQDLNVIESRSWMKDAKSWSEWLKEALNHIGT